MKSMKLIQEAALDDKFNTQLGKIQDAISKLNDIVVTMTAPGSQSKPVRSQAFAVKVIADDLKDLAAILAMPSSSNQK
jgi:hypothetical protein